MSKPNTKQRPSMSITPGGLAARGQSVAEAAASTPAVAAALQGWAKEPAERVAASIESEKPSEAAVSAPKPEEVQTPAASVETAQRPADDEDDGMFENAQPLAGRNLRPWTEKEKTVRDEVGSKGKASNFRLSAETYAKSWFLKEVTPGLTWDKMIDTALTRLVNRELRKLGYDV